MEGSADSATPPRTAFGVGRIAEPAQNVARMLDRAGTLTDRRFERSASGKHYVADAVCERETHRTYRLPAAAGAHLRRPLPTALPPALNLEGCERVDVGTRRRRVHDLERRHTADEYGGAASVLDSDWFRRGARSRRVTWRQWCEPEEHDCREERRHDG